ncbi:hypothetical protein N2152v2_010793 [Parachlorella kessleri]
MVLLVLQGTSLSLALRYSRVKPGTPYLGSVSVLLTELLKLAICLAVQLRSCRAGAVEDGVSVVKACRKQLQTILAQSLPMLLPAAMFVMQQVLLIIAATHLDAVAFQIFSQSFKLVPTALFAYWLLGQHLDPIQWASIPVLAAGVILVTINNGAAGGGAAAAALAARQAAGLEGSLLEGLGWVVGMVACSVSGLSSAYAGVYFEKYVKGKNAASLWVRNIQLGVWGVPLSCVYMAAKDGGRIRQAGVLQGFDASAWLVVALQVFGGLVTGMVVKYCDNILKNFALAISVILTVLVVIPLFGQWPSGFFLLGVGLVLLSVFMYGKAVDGDVLKRLLNWCKRCLPWVGEDGNTNRHLLYVFLASCLAVGGILGIYGMQLYVTKGIAAAAQQQQQQQQFQWQARVTATAKQGAESLASRARLRGAGALLKPVFAKAAGKQQQQR